MQVASADASLGQSPLRRIEVAAMVVVSAVMLVLPIVAAGARALTGATLTGTVVFVQHLTLWAGFIGALIATGRRGHLSLATSEFLPAGWPRETARFVASTVAASATAMLAYASIVMIQADRENNVRLFQLIPEWWSELVMPACLAAMAVRCAFQASGRWPLRLVSLALVFATFALDLAAGSAASVRWPGVALVVVAVLLGAPIYVGMSGLAMLLFFSDVSPIATVPIEIFRLVASATLPAIPLLTLCGYVLAEGGASRRLVRAARALVGFMPGGLAIMVVVVCAMFTTLTGGSGVTIIALGGLVLPILIKEGYPEGFAVGLVTAAGSLGLLFPPSLPVFLYSVVAESSADRLFVAGLVPGVLMMAMVMAYGVVVGRRVEAERHPFSLGEAREALWAAKWELSIPVVLFLGIFGGKATIVEASAIAAAMAVLSQVVLFKDLSLRQDLPRAVASSGGLMGAVLLVLGAAMGLTSYLVDAEIPSQLLGWVTANVKSPVVFLLALNIVLLVLGSVLEIYSAIVILAPLIVPLGVAFEIDPVHMGIVFLANLELGFLFPPVGLNLLLSSSRFKKPLASVYRMTAPFLLIMAIGVLIVTYWPALSVGVANALLPSTTGGSNH